MRSSKRSDIIAYIEEPRRQMAVSPSKMPVIREQYPQQSRPAHTRHKLERMLSFNLPNSHSVPRTDQFSSFPSSQEVA